jgi:hypothetical protein
MDDCVNRLKLSRALTLPDLNSFHSHFSLSTTSLLDELLGHENSKYYERKMSHMKEVQNEFAVLQQYNLIILHAGHTVFKSLRVLNVRNGQTTKIRPHNWKRTSSRYCSHVATLSWGNKALIFFSQSTKVGLPPPSVRRSGLQPSSPIPKTGPVIIYRASRRRQLLEVTETNSLAESGQLCKKPTSY